MRPIATDVARSVVFCLSVCVIVAGVCYAKMAEPIKMPIER